MRRAFAKDGIVKVAGGIYSLMIMIVLALRLFGVFSFSYLWFLLFIVVGFLAGFGDEQNV